MKKETQLHLGWPVGEYILRNVIFCNYYYKKYKCLDLYQWLSEKYFQKPRLLQIANVCPLKKMKLDLWTVKQYISHEYV